jgi:polyisoprenoid-binding protein YceI
MKRNTVTFKSIAPLEDIIGTSNEISGTLHFDPAKPEAGGSGMLSVPVASLDTGIPLRDEHLVSDQWLDAGKYPDITFKIVEVKDVKAVKVGDEAKTYDVVAVGDFSLKGKTKRISVPARITWLKETEATKKRQPGDLLAARATFDLELADFGIAGPAGMDLIGSKVGESVTIEFSVVASNFTGN